MSSTCLGPKGHDPATRGRNQLRRAAWKEGKSADFRERTAAAKRFPQGETCKYDPRAITLLDDVEELETRLLLALADETRVKALKPVKWEDVGMQVYLPMWQDQVREHAGTLAGVKPASLPEIARNLLEFGMKLNGPKDVALSDVQRIRQAAAGTLGAALALALKKQGWALQVLPGDEVCFQRAESTIKPFEVIQRLASGELDAEIWRQRCAAAGISELNFGGVATSE